MHLTVMNHRLIRSAFGASDRYAFSRRWAARPFVRPAYRRRAARRRIWLRRAAVVLAIVAAVLLIRWLLPPSGVVLRTRREFPCDPVYFYQQDPAWSEAAIGATGKTVGLDGDDVCCLASLMAMQRIPAPFGGDLNPATLNAWLSEEDCYDADGGLKWGKVAELLGAKLSGGYGARAASLLEELIQRQVYAVVRVKRPDTGKWHEVLVVGSVHGEFTIVDPLDPTGTLNTMGLYQNKIYDLRYLTREEAL